MLTTTFSRQILYTVAKNPVFILRFGLVIIAMAADDVTNINFDLEQFVTAVGIYAATNPL